MPEPKVVVVPPLTPERSSTTTRLLHLLTAALTILALSFSVLTYSYLRVAWQLDRTRSASQAQTKVIAAQSASLKDLAGFAALFAQSLVADDPAERAAAQRDLATLAERIRQDEETRTRGSTSTTSSTVKPAASSTTQPSRGTCVATVVCIGGGGS